MLYNHVYLLYFFRSLPISCSVCCFATDDSVIIRVPSCMSFLLYFVIVALVVNQAVLSVCAGSCTDQLH